MKRQKIYFLLIISVLFYLGQSKEVYAIGEEGKIYKNIYIENIDVSGLTKKEAIKKLNKEIYISDKINLMYDKNVYELKLKDINFNYKLEEAINNAYEFTRKDNFLQNIKTKFNLSFGKRRNLNLEPVFNDEKLDLYINNLCSNINIEPKNANIKVEKNQFNITNEINGISVDSKKLFELIKEELISKSYKDIQIPINIIYPEYNHENLSKINTVLGRFETEFNAKNLNRVNNIKVAVNNASNILLNSKKEFSFNEFIGKRSVDRGFKEAPVIVNGELTSGMGGGICQVSSTIYNSALYAGLEIVQARNHSIPSGYIPKGRDAAVSYGNIDLVFKNNYNNPVLIENKVEGNKIISTIYGNESDKKQIDIDTDILETIEPNTKIKDSDAIDEGKSKVESKGRKGYKVNTYRVYKNIDGQIEKKEFINESYYPPKDKVIIKGTKKNSYNIDTTNLKII